MYVYCTVSEMHSVKEWRSSSLKMAPFDRPYTTFY